LRKSQQQQIVCFDFEVEERRLTLASLAWYRFGESGRSFEEAFSQLVGLICWESFSQLAVRC
jgi:hypothetical protein